MVLTPDYTAETVEMPDELFTRTFGMKIPHSLQLATHLSPMISGCGHESTLCLWRLTVFAGTFGDT